MASTEDFVLIRTLDAPRELVWKVWTQAEHLGKWFSPKGFGIIAANMDFRVGGIYQYGLRMPDGGSMWGKWAFREIVAPERMVVVQCFSDEHGGVSRHPMAPDWPQYTLSTMTFAEQGERTAEAAGQRAWGERLARLLVPLLADPALRRAGPHPSRAGPPTPALAPRPGGAQVAGSTEG